MADEWDSLPDVKAPGGDEWDALPDAKGAQPDRAEQSIPSALLDRIALGAVTVRDMYGYTLDVGKSAGKQAVEGTIEQAHSVNARLNPFSAEYQAGRESGAWTGPGTQIGVGKGLFDLATLPLAPFGGTLSELIAQPYSKLTGMPIEQAREAAGTALFALRPGRGPNAPNFSRPRVGPDGTVADQPIGGLPKDADFKVSAEALDTPATPTVESNLKRMWNEDGIHPAEAVHDAANDAFVKHDLVQPIEAFHGSPHDFTVFSKEKIGTGEGAQSYGHGLYFAENEKVAADYSAKLSQHAINPKAYEDANLGPRIKKTQADFKAADEAYAREMAAVEDGRGDVTREQAVRDERGRAAMALEEIENEASTKYPNTGTTYQVAIHANRDHFLDFDKPISEQSKFVQDAIRSMPRYEGYKDLIENGAPMGMKLKQGLLPGSFTPEGATAALQEAGIPGIKYLDQGSRPAGGAMHSAGMKLEEPPKTSNFVVFDDSAVQIVKKNGQPFYDENFAKAHNDKLERIMDGREEGEIPLRAVGAEVTTEPPIDTPLSVTPAKPPGSLMTAAHKAADTLLDIGRDAQMLVAPMARGIRDSMAMAKDFANTMRRNRWDWARIDAEVEKNFTPEQRTRMWNAADEESVARQLGESLEHQGLVTLEPAERAAVEQLQTRAQTAWLRARDLGMVEGEGLPAYTPRMLMNVAVGSDRGGPIPLNGIGLNLRTQTGGMKRRMYLTAEETEAAAKRLVGQRGAMRLDSLEEINAAVDQVRIARDIRALPLATAKLEDAIAGRTLINNIKEYGKSTGAEMVSEGAIPAETEAKWFTLDHPAFRTWRPKLERGEDGKASVVKDANGNVMFEQVPIYVHGDFEGPLRAVLTQRSGPLYGAMMSLKGKTMSLIMNSPMIHNAVEWGRALPAMPGKVATFKVYFEGNKVKNDPVQMREAIDAGLVPIGKRFFNQDITSIMESPDLTPGRSWTAKVLGAVPGLFDEAAGVAVKRSIDKAGDFWHNTLLWDRIADLQAGLYSNFRDSMVAKGIDRQTAARTAAHWANRYAGALPQEAMSDAARKVANTLLFSRSFTLGNLGVIKDMVTGLPKDVIAQIERDAGFGRGSIAAADAESPAAQAVSYAKTMARRKAMSVVLADIALMYVGNSLLQSVLNVVRSDHTADQEMKGYADRFAAAMDNVKEHPLALLQPFDFMNRVASTYENEPGKQDRIRVGTAKDGTAIYMRNPAGKIGEEFIGYMSGPLDMMRRKLGTIARPGWQILSNDKGFGRKVYDPDADTPAKYAANLGRIAAHLAMSQVPEGQMNAAMDLVKGEGDKNVNAAQALGPFAGVTFAKGAPGGPAVGEMYHAKTQHQFAIDQALPDIRKQIQRGDLTGAQERMSALNIAPGLQRFYIKTSQFPETRLGGRTLKDFYQYATPEQLQRMDRAQQQR